MKINILCLFVHIKCKARTYNHRTNTQIIIKKFNFFSLTHIKKMDENKFSRYCTILLIDDDNHSKIFVSEKK